MNDTPPEQAPEPTPAERQAALEAKAGRIGGILGRLARRVVTTAQPEVERAAERARAAAETALPRIEQAATRAANGAVEFAKAHEDEIRRVAETGARVAADRVVHPALRPLVDAAAQDLQRPALPAPGEPPAGPPPPAQR